MNTPICPFCSSEEIKKIPLINVKEESYPGVCLRCNKSFKLSLRPPNEDIEETKDIGLPSIEGNDGWKILDDPYKER